MIPALFDHGRVPARIGSSAHIEPEVTESAECRARDEVLPAIFAYLCIFGPCFRVNGVEKPYRRAIINYLRKNNTNKKSL